MEEFAQAEARKASVGKARVARQRFHDQFWERRWKAQKASMQNRSARWFQ